MYVSFDAINLLIALAIVANSAYGLLVMNSNRAHATNRAFFALTTAVSAWGLAMIAYRGFSHIALAAMAAHMLYAVAALIPFMFLRFAWVFPQQSARIGAVAHILAALPAFGAIVLSLVPGLFITGIEEVLRGERVIHFFLPGQTYYAGYMTIYFTWVLLHLARNAYRATGETRIQFLYILFATSVPPVVSSITNLYLPFLGVFTYNWVGQISIVATTTIITYGMFRHKVFNARVIGTEVLMFILWSLSFSNIVSANDVRTLLTATTVFVLTTVFGILMVRSTIREVEAREETQRLATNLAAANEQLRELDRQKSEFLSIASHQLRTPLAAIKGYASLMLESAYGTPSEAMYAPIRTIFESSTRMADTVNDFLNVSRIEQGKMEYRMKKTDFALLLKQVLNELSVSAGERALTLRAEDDRSGPYWVDMDISKMQHVVSNLIDNALKYTPKGSVTARLAHVPDGRVQFTVTDTGAGIPKEAIGTLFDKFVRARNAKDINVTGTGLGLYVAKEIVRAHNGTIDATSEGEGRGSVFTVTLPGAR